jgi:hypothetical protein
VATARPSQLATDVPFPVRVPVVSSSLCAERGAVDSLLCIRRRNFKRRGTYSHPMIPRQRSRDSQLD